MRSFIGRVKRDALVTASSRRKGQQKQRNKKFEKKRTGNGALRDTSTSEFHLLVEISGDVAKVM
jgi:hypothetical protein